MRLSELDPQEVMNIDNYSARPFFSHSDFFVGELQESFQAAFVDAQKSKTGDDEATARAKINQLLGDGLTFDFFRFGAKNWQPIKLKAAIEFLPEGEEISTEYRLLNPEEMLRVSDIASQSIFLKKTLFRVKELLEEIQNVLGGYCKVNSDLWINKGVKCEVLRFGVEEGWQVGKIGFFVGFFPDRQEPQGRAEAAKIKTEVAKAEVLDKAINETLDRIDQE